MTRTLCCLSKRKLLMWWVNLLSFFKYNLESLNKDGVVLIMFEEFYLKFVLQFIMYTIFGLFTESGTWNRWWRDDTCWSWRDSHSKAGKLSNHVCNIFSPNFSLPNSILVYSIILIVMQPFVPNWEHNLMQPWDKKNHSLEQYFYNRGFCRFYLLDPLLRLFSLLGCLA